MLTYTLVEQLVLLCANCLKENSKICCLWLRYTCNVCKRDVKSNVQLWNVFKVQCGDNVSVHLSFTAMALTRQV